MDAVQAILTRRSTRNYKAAKEVPKEVVLDLLRCAMHAPSAADERPWHFVVFDDPDVLAKIPGIHPYAGMVDKAPLAVLVCGEPGREIHTGMWAQDCAAATQNLLLAAHAMGLGGVWVGIYPREERMAPFRQLARLPAHVQPFALVPIGYPVETTETKEDLFSADRVHKNRW